MKRYLNKQLEMNNALRDMNIMHASCVCIYASGSPPQHSSHIWALWAIFNIILALSCYTIVLLLALTWHHTLQNQHRHSAMMEGNCFPWDRVACSERIVGIEVVAVHAQLHKERISADIPASLWILLCLKRVFIMSRAELNFNCIFSSTPLPPAK